MSTQRSCKIERLVGGVDIVFVNISDSCVVILLYKITKPTDFHKKELRILVSYLPEKSC